MKSFGLLVDAVINLLQKTKDLNVPIIIILEPSKNAIALIMSETIAMADQRACVDKIAQTVGATPIFRQQSDSNYYSVDTKLSGGIKLLALAKTSNLAKKKWHHPNTNETVKALQALKPWACSLDPRFVEELSIYEKESGVSVEVAVNSRDYISKIVKNLPQVTKKKTRIECMLTTGHPLIAIDVS